MKLNSAPTSDDKPLETDLYVEPIAQGGLRSRYQVLGDEPWNDTGKLMVEVLLKPEKVVYLASAAADLDLAYEIVNDANGTRWQILEVQGSREAINAFIVVVEKVNIRRTA